MAQLMNIAQDRITIFIVHNSINVLYLKFVKNLFTTRKVGCGNWSVLQQGSWSSDIRNKIEKILCLAFSYLHPKSLTPQKWVIEFGVMVCSYFVYMQNKLYMAGIRNTSAFQRYITCLYFILIYFCFRQKFENFRILKKLKFFHSGRKLILIAFFSKNKHENRIPREKLP